MSETAMYTHSEFWGKVDKIKKLEAENAKLRKAITFMLDEATNYPMNLRSDGPFDALAAALEPEKLVLTGDVFVDGDVLAEGYPHNKMGDE